MGFFYLLKSFKNFMFVLFLIQLAQSIYSVMKSTEIKTESLLQLSSLVPSAGVKENHSHVLREGLLARG